MIMPEFTFDRSLQRYRNNKGKFISESKMLELTQKTIDLAKKDVNTIGDLLIAGKLSLAEWERGTAMALKQLHTQSYLLGRGGQKMMNQSDYGSIGYALQQQYYYLSNFAQDIKLGMSQAQFKARLNQYVAAGRTSYEWGRRNGHKEAGYTWERRKLGVAHHCNPCVNYSEMGWVIIGSLPGIGQQCDCRANCKCSFEFSLEQPTNNAPFTRPFGWLNKNSFSSFLFG
jgi:hypothetical protein